MTEGQPVEQKKKGLPALAWIGIGCGGLIVIGVVVAVIATAFLFAKVKDVAEDISENPVAVAAETVVRFNPELELVESDREAGKIRVREVKTGKVVTFNYEDIQDGKFSFENEEGESVSFDASVGADGESPSLTIATSETTIALGVSGAAIDLPDWLPLYSGNVAEQGGFSSTTNTERSGTLSFKSSDGADQILQFYEKVLEDLGIEANRTSFSGGGGSLTSLSGSSSTHEVSASVSQSPGEDNSVAIIYRGPA